MTNSASITVTNHRLKKAMSNANDDDLKSHSKKMGEKLKSELKLKIGEVIEICSDTETAKVKIDGKTETCLIAHDTYSEGMGVVGYPKGKSEVRNKKHYIIPSDTIYGVVCLANDKNKDKHILLNYVNYDCWINHRRTKQGEYKIQVGDNYISLDSRRINIKSDNLFINGLPYTEAYEPLKDYHNKEEIGDMFKEFVDKIYPIGSIYMSMNNTSPSDLFGGTWEQLKDTFLLASGDVYPSDGDVSTAQHGESNHTLTVDEMPKHKHDLSYRTGVIQTGSSGTYYFDVGTSGNWYTNSPSFKESGGNNAHNNMPPYMSVYMWKRIR